MKAEPIPIGSRRELLWDEYLIDTTQTTATLRLHQPQPKEVVLTHGEAWEGDMCDYHCILKDDDRYRMYYLAWRTCGDAPMIAYAESTDGLLWVKPQLGLCAFEGARDNNIILDKNTDTFDNFSVFRDSNPNCPPDEVYKGVGLDGSDHWLWCFTSADGVRFKKAWRMTDRGKFDTLNVAFWDRHTAQYFCYIRDFHNVPSDGRLNEGIRDIRWMVSEDFKTWTTPVLLDFGEGEDYPLYTNVAQPYYRGDHMFVGFPSRYVERKEWTPNFEQLPGVQRRKERMKRQPRYGLAVTDCVFMCSRDGKHWKRWDEAFMRPGPERDYNWVYGDCYPAVGMIETPSPLPDAAPELSMFAFENHWGRIPAELRRYTIRMDGFVSYHATFQPQRVVTKPFTFEGRALSVNFATSAAGYVKITLRGNAAELTSCELFGDSIDRRVVFQGGEVSSLAGQQVTMEMEMSDADVYSFKFMP